MRPFLKTLLPALAVVLALSAFAVVPARAEPGEGGQDEISAQIQKQMDKIIELMERNEKALLALSTGNKAKPEAVDVKPPALPPSQEGEGKEGSGRTGKTGEDARKAIDELIKSQRKTAGSIPGELEELVRMVPQ